MSIKPMEFTNSTPAQIERPLTMLTVIPEEAEDDQATTQGTQPKKSDSSPGKLEENEVDEKVQEVVAQFRAGTVLYIANRRGPNLDPIIPKTPEGRKYMN